MQKKEYMQCDLIDFQLWSEESSAYIKQDKDNGVWLICDVTGEKLAAGASRDEAFVIARQNELEPYSVH